ncbi:MULTISPECIES: hypothetical protein [unclassified Streptomyces]|uniref:hypothetical protein n=1 Tax=unclassified Streptomyces TaxID=2593676 RepID=UPI002DDA739E|nr:hypothetical protein [Streptomyces sp. NBC_01237]WRZ76355.1 hypothetical protein OG251_34650 [Streptomyces sp. NBC_01237]
MRLLSAWRKLLRGDEDGAGPDNGSRSHWHAGILAGLAGGSVAIHALASKRLKRAEAPDSNYSNERRRT